MIDKVEEAMAFIKGAPEKVREDPAIKQLLLDLEKDYKEDNLLAQGNS